MSLFLFKPHIIRPDGTITTPDVIVDHVFLDGELKSVNLLTSDLWQQTMAGESARSAYAITALGGGALIGPAVVLKSGPIVIARKAWRLNSLEGRIGNVLLNGVSLSEIGDPGEMIAAAGGSGDTLPRGFMLLRTAAGDAGTAVLVDKDAGRSLEQRVVFEIAVRDRWGRDRPKPRYSVGPTQREVEHFL